MWHLKPRQVASNSSQGYVYIGMQTSLFPLTAGLKKDFFKFEISNQHFWQHCPSPFLVKVLHRLKHGLLVHEQHQKVFLAVQQPPQQIVQTVQDQLDRVSWHHCCCTKCRIEPWVPFTSFRNKKKKPRQSRGRAITARFSSSLPRVFWQQRVGETAL